MKYSDRWCSISNVVVPFMAFLLKAILVQRIPEATWPVLDIERDAFAINSAMSFLHGAGALMKCQWELVPGLVTTSSLCGLSSSRLQCETRLALKASRFSG